jgi:excisionase family DNA binding protein
MRTRRAHSIEEECVMAGHSHPDPPRALLSVEEAADVLSIGRTSMYGYLKAGLVRSVKLGHRRFVPADAIAAYIKRLSEQQQDPTARRAEGN